MSDRVAEQATRSPNRPLVIKWYSLWEAWTYLGDDHAWEYEPFPTHADAIEYAHEQATRQALAARFTIPPENPVARAIQEPTC